MKRMFSLLKCGSIYIKRILTDGIKSNKKRQIPPTPSMGTVLEAIIKDFEVGWEGVGLVKKQDSNPDTVGWGNFHFALLAMLLLEVALRVTEQTFQTKKLINNLQNKDPGYFETIKGVQLCLDNPLGKISQNSILAIIIDLVRNGHAHYYEAISADLEPPGRSFITIALSGPHEAPVLTGDILSNRIKHHLVLVSDSKESSRMLLNVRTDLLFLDIRDSIKDLGLLEVEVPFSMDNKQRYFSINEVKLKQSMKKIQQRREAKLMKLMTQGQG